MPLENELKRLILKALTGPQSGVEVALADGEYTLGSGLEDDLQFVDVCLKSGHARIRIEKQEIRVAGGAGSLISETGTVIDAGDDEWRELKPLETIIIGSSVFAFGSENADWSSVSEKLGGKRNEDAKRSWHALPYGLEEASIKKGAAASVAVLLVVCLIWLIGGAFISNKSFISSSEAHSLDTLKQSLESFEFTSTVELSQEVDGSIYASGYVTKPIERRALQNAFAETGVPLNFRVWVLSSIKTQLEAAIENFGVDVAFSLSPNGRAMLRGTILSDEKANRFIDYVRNEIKGISGVDYDVRTAISLYEEVNKLAERSGVDETVLLHLLNERIEASGVVVSDKLDAWVGFLQSYARRYADDIPLTSYVQLVNDQGVVIAEANPTRLGRENLPIAAGTINLDISRLKEGEVQASDLFQGINSQPENHQTANVPTDENAGKQDKPRASEEVDANPQKRIDVAQGNLSDGIRQLLKKTDLKDDGEPGDVSADSRSPQGDHVLEEVLGHWDAGAIREKYLSLVFTPETGLDRCWKGSKVRVSDIPVVLFWLDYLSLSTQISLIDFPQDNQHLLLETAMNPVRTRRCAVRAGKNLGLHFDQMSLYLEETDLNPNFVRYLVRDFSAPSMKVTGVMLREQRRFIQIADGTKVLEGSSPDLESKLISVGALGALLKRASNFSPIVYSDNLTWKASN